MKITARYITLSFLLSIAGVHNVTAQKAKPIRWNIVLETKDKSVITGSLSNEIRRAVNGKLSSICHDSIPAHETRFQGNKVSLIVTTTTDTALIAEKLIAEPSLLFLSPYPKPILEKVKDQIRLLEEQHEEKIILLAPSIEKTAQIGISRIKDTSAMWALFAQVDKKGVLPPSSKIYTSNRPGGSVEFGITHGVHLLNKDKPILQGDFVKSAKTALDNGNPIVHLQLNSTATKILADYTRNHIGEVIGIIINNKIVMDPFIYGPLLQGSITLNGLGTIEQTKEIADQIGFQYPVTMKLTGIFAAP